MKLKHVNQQTLLVMFASGASARDMGQELARVCDIDSQNGTRFTKECLCRVGMKKQAQEYSRNNAHANYEAGIRALAQGLNVDDSHILYSSVSCK